MLKVAVGVTDVCNDPDPIGIDKVGTDFEIDVFERAHTKTEGGGVSGEEHGVGVETSLEIKVISNGGGVNGPAIEAAGGCVEQLKANSVKSRYIGGEPASVDVAKGIRTIGGADDAFTDVETIDAIGRSDGYGEDLRGGRGIHIFLPEVNFSPFRAGDRNYLSDEISALGSAIRSRATGIEGGRQGGKGGIRGIKIGIERIAIAHEKAFGSNTAVGVDIVGSAINNNELRALLLAGCAGEKMNVLAKGPKAAPG